MICPILKSQTTIEPSTLVPNKKLKDAARLIEIGAINAEKIKLYEQQVEFLNSRISIKDSIINTFILKDTAQNKILQTYKDEVANLIQQRDLAALNVKKQNKLYRRQKRKTVFIAIAGPAITAAAFIYLKN